MVTGTLAEWLSVLVVVLQSNFQSSILQKKNRFQFFGGQKKRRAVGRNTK